MKIVTTVDSIVQRDKFFFFPYHLPFCAVSKLLYGLDGQSDSSVKKDLHILSWSDVEPAFAISMEWSDGEPTDEQIVEQLQVTWEVMLSFGVAEGQMPELLKGAFVPWPVERRLVLDFE